MSFGARVSRVLMVWVDEVDCEGEKRRLWGMERHCGRDGIAVRFGRRFILRFAALVIDKCCRV